MKKIFIILFISYFFIIGSYAQNKIAHWRFDETAETVATEDIRSMNGILYNFSGTPWAKNSDTGSGILDYGDTEVTDNASYVEVAANPVLDISSGDFTIAVYAKTYPDAYRTEMRFVSRYNSATGHKYSLCFRNGNLQFEGTSNNGAFRMQRAIVSNNSLKALADGVWCLYVVVVNRETNKGRMYLNGTLCWGEADITSYPIGSFSFANEPLIIGNTSENLSADRRLRGGIDDVRFFDYALTTSEVAALYAEVSASQSKVPITDVSIINCPENQIDAPIILTTSILPENATNKNIIWSSSNTDVAIVNHIGKVTGLSVGSAAIKARTADGNKTSECVVTIGTPYIPVTGISLTGCPGGSIGIGSSVNLSASVLPANTSNKNVSWSSSAPDIASVDDDGKVKALAAGSVTITVTSTEDNKSATCTITIVEDIPAVVDVKARYLPVYTEAEYNAGVVSGDNQQYMNCFAYSEANPDRLYQAQDMGAVWVSLDAGRNWHTLKNNGLYSKYIMSIEADPLDPERVLVAAACRTYDPTHANYQGIYLTTDGGINWEKVQGISQLTEIRQSTRVIAYAPSSKDTEKGYATRWYAVFSKYDNGSTTAEDGFWYSDDGGSNWTKVRELPVTDFGALIVGTKVHPSDPQKVFVYGENGLIRFDDATNVSGAYENMSGRNGLPTGKINGDLYLSEDGNTIIVAVSGKGIYKSTDAGGSWSDVYEWNIINKCFINPSFPDRIYATASRSGEASQIRVSKNGGATWNTSVSSIPVPGYSGIWNTHIHGGFVWVVPDPRNPDRAFAHGNAKHHQTDNGGDTWYPSNGYFNGNQIQSINQEQIFDPSNPDRFFYFMIDVGIHYTENRGKWFGAASLNTSAWGITSKSCTSGALHPDAATGIVLASIGGSSKGIVIRSTDNGKSWSVVREDLAVRRVIAFDMQNPDYCYQRRERSSDTGATWEEMSNMPENAVLAGVSLSDGKILYALIPSGSNRKVYRSKDRGETWEEAFTSDVRLVSPNDANFFTFRIHPTNPDIVFTSGGNNGQLIKWDISDPVNPKKTILTVISGEEGSYICRLAIDRRFPDIMYAANIRENTGNLLFRTQDGGATWENIGKNITSINSLEVSPLTGEVFISGGHGARVILPPYETENTAYEATAVNDPFIGEPYSDACSTVSEAPVANFNADKQDVEAGGNIRFADISSNIPSTWQWAFEGGEPSSSTERTPVVKYDIPGIYSVTLIAGNCKGNSSELVKESFIEVTGGNSGDNGLLYHWKFDETAGLTAKEEINSLNGALVNFPEGDTHWTSGFQKGSLDFDKSFAEDKSYVVKTTNLSMSNRSFTIVAYANLKSSFTKVQRFVNHVDGQSSYTYYLKKTGENIQLRFDLKNTTGVATTLTYTVPAEITEDVWTMYTAVLDMDSGQAKLYLNDELLGSKAFSGILSINTPLYIGNTNETNLIQRLRGLLDDLRIYDHALTDEEVADLYADLSTSPVPVTGVSITNCRETPFYENTVYQLTAAIEPAEAKNKKLTWYSDNTRIATVDSDGNVTILSEGTANITVTTEDGGFTSRCVVDRIQAIIAESIEIENCLGEPLIPETQYQFSYTFYPEDAVDPEVIWSSDDVTIASINSGGLLTAHQPGTTVITLTTNDWSQVTACEIMVSGTSKVEIQEKSLAKLYPNPNNGIFYLNFEEPGLHKVTISNNAGVIKSVEGIEDVVKQIDISGYPSGMYLITIEKGKRKNTLKVLKNE